MGLADIYGRVPDSFAARDLARQDQAAASIPAAYSMMLNQRRAQLENEGLGLSNIGRGLSNSEQELRNAALRQANIDAEYGSPARAANPVEQSVGSWAQSLLANEPPEFVERLRREVTTPSQLGPVQSQPTGIRALDDPYGLAPVSDRPSPMLPVEGGASWIENEPAPRPAQPPIGTVGDVNLLLRSIPQSAAMIRAQRPASGGLTLEQRLELMLRTKEQERQGSQEHDERIAAVKEAERKLQKQIAEDNFAAKIYAIQERARTAETETQRKQIQGDAQILLGQMKAAATSVSSLANITNNPRTVEYYTWLMERIKAAEAAGLKSGSSESTTRTKTESTTQPAYGKGPETPPIPRTGQPKTAQPKKLPPGDYNDKAGNVWTVDAAGNKTLKKKAK